MICSICEGLKTLHNKNSDVSEKVIHPTEIDKSRQNGCEGCEIIYKTIQVSTTAWNSIATITLYLVDFAHLFLHYKEGDNRTEEYTGEMIYPMSRTETPWTAIKVEKISDWRPPTLATSIPWIKNWLSKCDQYHQPCKIVSEPSEVPTRLLDVGSPYVAPRLHITQGNFAQYIALSHCWGAPGNGNRRINTTHENFTEHCNGIPYNEFPRTFQHAIEVTRELGLKYLWIDCLCIIQNSPQDWDYEADRMADVYRNSYITLASDYAAHPGEGLFLANFSRSPGTYSFQQAHLPTGSEFQIFARRPIFFDEIGAYECVIEEGCHSAERLSMLDPRAWALQERILSRRLIHFTNTELMWECREDYLCHCGHHPGKVTLKKTFDEEMYDIPEVSRVEGPYGLDYLWEEFVKGLTERSLTFATDWLPAASGIAKLISTSGLSQMGRYLAGHWEKDLASSLFWENVSSRYDLVIESSTNAEHDLLELEMHLCGNKDSSYRIPGRYAPTWSWASVSARIGFDYAESLILDGCLTGISCIPSTFNPYGPVEDAWLEIEGTLLGIQVNRELQRNKGREGAKSTVRIVLVARLKNQSTLRGIISSDAGICSTEMRDPFGTYSIFFPGRLELPSQYPRVRGLVLKEVSSHDFPTFMRVGSIAFDQRDNLKELMEASRTRIRIV